MDKSGSLQHLVCAALFTCSASFAFAEEELFDLDLQALANIKVTSASRTEQTIQTAPSIISVITREDIDRYGANNLFDVMQYFPGYLSLSNGVIGRSGMALRGDSSFSSERLLTLVDGKPYRSMNSSGYVTNTLYQNFPLAGVERIELIRGPGSALYGSGAVTGVINIITRKATSKSSGELSAQAGTYDSNQESFFWGTPNDGNNSWRINTAANVSKSDGWVVHDGAGLGLNNYNKGQSLLVDVSNDHFYVKSLLMNMNANYPSLVLGDLKNIQDITHQYVDTGYNAQINQQSSFDVHYSHLSIDNGLLNIQNTEDLVEANVFSNLSESTLFQAGLSLNQSQSDTTNNNITGLENYPEFRGGLYAQINNQFDKQWSTYVGGQWNKTEGSDGSFSPRLGLIYAHDEVSGAKLLYSEAFRLPNAAESNETFTVSGITDPVFVGNNNLSSETVKTTDLQWYHYATSVNYTVTLFTSDYQNRLRPQPLQLAFTPFPVVVSPGKWVQDSDLHVYGVEW